MTNHEASLLPIVFLAFCCGCTSKAQEPPGDARSKQQLAEVHRMVKAYDAAKKPFPSRFEDLRQSEGSFPFALHALRSGECVLVWSAVTAPADDAILAYAKDTPGMGGLVVLKNGTVKKMTSEELKSSLPRKR